MDTIYNINPETLTLMITAAHLYFHKEGMEELEKESAKFKHELCKVNWDDNATLIIKEA